MLPGLAPSPGPSRARPESRPLLARLLALLVEALAHRLGAAREAARPCQRLGARVALGRGHRTRGFAELAFDGVDIGADLLLERGGLVGRRALHEAPRVPDLVAQTAVANGVGSLLHLARRLLPLAPEVGRGAIELPLQAVHFARLQVLALDQLLHLLLPPGA